MKKWHILEQIHQHGVVAVLRGESPEQAVALAEQAIAGGIKIIEVTLTVPFALKAIEQLAVKYSSNPDDENFAIIGAGTVLDSETARAAILSGSQFIVGPSLNEGTVRLCNRYGIPVLPGVMTMQEVQTALELGADVMKLFPGNLFSPEMIGAIKAPVPQANLMPTGGVSLNNLADWIKAGAFAVGIGSDLTKEALATGDYSKTAEKASQYVTAFQAAKNS